MKVYRGIAASDLRRKPRSVALGVFDGLHRGHAKILATLLRDARQYHVSPMVVTFDPHPMKVLALKKCHPTILMSLEHKLEMLKSFGVKEVCVMRFNARVAAMDREVFLSDILLKKLGAVSITVGHDFRFGKNAAGDGAYLSEQSQRSLKYRLYRVPAQKYKGEVISSTRIRGLIENGDLVLAKKLLGRPVSVVGTVVHGRGRGKLVGFPTANLNPHHEALPPEGVYAAHGYLGEQKLKGVIHIGQRPTFNDRAKSLEVHFLNFHRSIYGRAIELAFVKRLRGIQKFPSIERLHKAIQNDIRSAQMALKG